MNDPRVKSAVEGPGARALQALRSGDDHVDVPSPAPARRHAGAWIAPAALLGLGLWALALWAVLS